MYSWKNITLLFNCVNDDWEKIHVLIISQYFPPDILGESTRAHNYCKTLTDQGYNITVITAPPHQHGPIPKKQF